MLHCSHLSFPPAHILIYMHIATFVSVQLPSSAERYRSVCRNVCRSNYVCTGNISPLKQFQLLTWSDEIFVVPKHQSEWKYSDAHEVKHANASVPTRETEKKPSDQAFTWSLGANIFLLDRLWTVTPAPADKAGVMWLKWLHEGFSLFWLGCNLDY